MIAPERTIGKRLVRVKSAAQRSAARPKSGSALRHF
jgi:hypothetical protein